jgi:hypothetical protein
LDHFPFILDFLEACLSLYGVFLFSWWWLLLRKASSVYAIVILIMAGFAYQNIIALYARHLVHSDAEFCHRIAHATWYITRDVPTFIGILAVEIAMTTRAIRTVRHISQTRDVKGDVL